MNLIVGDFNFNAEKIKQHLKQARRMGADVVLFPELAVTGYPPEDLLLKESFLKQCDKNLKKISRYSKGLLALIEKCSFQIMVFLMRKDISMKAIPLLDFV